MIEVKILGYHSAQRYAVRQTLVAAQRILRVDHPEVEISITELKDWMHIEEYTPVLSAPSLVVNEKLVCVGRFPSREDVISWLRCALDEWTCEHTCAKLWEGTDMKKAISVVLDDEQIVQLMRILIDDDAEDALKFVKQHFKGKARELLEGGWKVMIEVPGAGIVQVTSNMFKPWELMYLETISLTKILPCLAEPGKIIVIGEPSRKLDEVLPYLATLPNVIAYNPDARTLTLRRQPGFISLYSEKAYITKVKDTEEGLELLKALVDAINATWDHREELVAMTARKHAPRPLDIWTLLPQTNCKKCGEATCMAFACNLLLQERTLEECTPLAVDDAFAERRATLAALFLWYLE